MSHAPPLTDRDWLTNIENHLQAYVNDLGERHGVTCDECLAEHVDTEDDGCGGSYDVAEVELTLRVKVRERTRREVARTLEAAAHYIQERLEIVR